jgi:ATP-dependent Lon protease
MLEALMAADAYLKAHMNEVATNRDPKQCDFTVQATGLNHAKEDAETASALFILMVSAFLDRATDAATVVAGEMSVKGMMQRETSLPERVELARDAGATRILVPSQSTRDLVDVPDEVLNQIQPVFNTHPINAAIRAMRLE